MNWLPLSHPIAFPAPPLQQSDGYARACAAIGAEVQWLGASSGDAPFGQATVVSRRWPLIGSVAQVARGPVWSADTSPERAAQAAERLVRELRQTHAAVILAPDPVCGTDPLTRAGVLPLWSPSIMARLSLAGSEQDRRARQTAKWRNRMVRAEATGLVVEHAPLGKDAGHWLLAEEVRQARCKRYRGLPAAFSHVWRVVNGARSTRIFTARHSGQTVAAMLFLLHGKGATYQIGWTTETGRQLNAHTLLLWRASVWLAARGTHWIDLGLLDTERAPGLARFKLGAGAEAMALGTTWIDAPAARLFAALPSPGVRSRPYRKAPG